MDRSQLKYLVKKHNINPRRQNGQNFLSNPGITKKLLESAELNSDDTVLEIGAGLGAVTAELATTAKKVIAVEMDRDFIPVLNNLKKANNNLEIINKNIFDINFVETGRDLSLQNGHFKLISNLPFNITSKVFRHFLEHGPQPSLISVIIQKEVAERITAKPGDMSILSASIQLFGEPKIEKIVKKSQFWPQPEVDCAILTVKNIKNPANISDISLFFRLLRIGFSSKRKKLASNIANGLKIDKEIATKKLKSIGLTENARAQELSMEKWVLAFDLFKSFMI